MEERVIQLDFSAAFDRVSHCGLVYKLKSIGVGKQFSSIASEFLRYRRQRVRLDGKVSASVDVVSGVPQGSVLGPLLFILCIILCYASTLLETILWALQLIPRSMQLFLYRFRILKWWYRLIRICQESTIDVRSGA